MASQNSVPYIFSEDYPTRIWRDSTATCLSQSKLYQSVVDDVIANVREIFLEDGLDDTVLHELKQQWEEKLRASKAVEVEQKPDQVLAVYAQHQKQAALKRQQLTTGSPVTTPAKGPLQNTIPHHQNKTIPSQLPNQVPVAGSAQHLISTLSAPAQAAAVALPPNIYQQQLIPGTIITGQGGVQYIVQAPPIVQQQQQQQGTSFAVASSNITQSNQVPQTDGPNDSSSEEEFDKDDDDEDDDDEENEKEEDEDGEEEEPLNSDDDVSDEDPADLFDTDNVVVCQYDKINRNKNKWKFHLKDGIMNLNGRDFVFNKGNGDAEW